MSGAARYLINNGLGSGAGIGEATGGVATGGGGNGSWKVDVRTIVKV